MDIKRNPTQRPGREPTKQVLDWRKIVAVVCIPLLIVFVFFMPHFVRYWVIVGAEAEAERIKIIGDILETPEGALYIQYLEGKK